MNPYEQTPAPAAPEKYNPETAPETYLPLIEEQIRIFEDFSKKYPVSEGEAEVDRVITDADTRGVFAALSLQSESVEEENRTEVLARMFRDTYLALAAIKQFMEDKKTVPGDWQHDLGLQKPYGSGEENRKPYRIFVPNYRPTAQETGKYKIAKPAREGDAFSVFDYLKMFIDPDSRVAE